jgi:DNA-directed RNA polymerase specialized sigma24 family protein
MYALVEPYLPPLFDRARISLHGDHDRIKILLKVEKHLSPAEDLIAGQPDPVDPIDQIDFDYALDELERLDPRRAKMVELRYFGGWENAEIDAVLGISEPTVRRDSRVACAWRPGAVIRPGP